MWGVITPSARKVVARRARRTQEVEKVAAGGFFLDLSAVFLRPEGQRELNRVHPVHPGLSFQPEWALKGPYGATGLAPTGRPHGAPFRAKHVFWAIDCPKFCLTSRHSSQGFTLST